MSKHLETLWSALSWFAPFAASGAFTVGFGPCGSEWLLLGAVEQASTQDNGGRHVG
jgi:hypothetical protein